jgi:2-dehydro-3-deoxygalactonokinase
MPCARNKHPGRGEVLLGASPAFAAVDWGTSRMRVWLLAQDGTVCAERRADEGLEAAGRGGFAEILEKHLGALGAAPDLPVIMCGMVGSRQGWAEAPYVDCPASFSAIIDGAKRIEGHARAMSIMPGVANRIKSAPDVMRGEETQIIGMMHARGGESALAVMPGTHSKWVSVANGAIESFRTWITGELYALLSRQSILRHSIGTDPRQAKPTDAAFLDGVRIMLHGTSGLLSELFSIRAGSLLFGADASMSAARLSGLLIGAEVADARALHGNRSKVLLVGGNVLGDLYGMALEMAGFSAETVDADEAVRSGLLAAASRQFAFAG